MDIITLALIVLIVTNISFALLANHWRKQAKHHAGACIRLALITGSARKEGYAAGSGDGARQGTGGMYLAAVRAGADEDVLEALRKAGRRLTGAEIEQPEEVAA